MAFILDMRSESEEEFEQETDRFDELKGKLLSGRSMKYEELEELMELAKQKNDAKVIGILKNLVDSPDGKIDEADEPAYDTAEEALCAAIESLAGRNILIADECEYDAFGKLLRLKYSSSVWLEGYAATGASPEEAAALLKNDITDSVAGDLLRIRAELLNGGGYKAKFSESTVPATVSAAVRNIIADPAARRNAIADCVIDVPCELAVTRVSEDVAETDEPEWRLPERIVSEAIGTLGRMY